MFYFVVFGCFVVHPHLILNMCSFKVFLVIHIVILIFRSIFTKSQLTRDPCQIESVQIVDPSGKNRTLLEEGFEIRIYTKGNIPSESGLWLKRKEDLKLLISQPDDNKRFSMRADKDFLNRMRPPENYLDGKFLLKCQHSSEAATFPFPKVVFCAKKDQNAQKCEDGKICMVQGSLKPRCQTWKSSYDCHFESRVANMHGIKEKSRSDGSIIRSECEEMVSRAHGKIVIKALDSSRYNDSKNAWNLCNMDSFQLSCVSANCKNWRSHSKECEEKISARSCSSHKTLEIPSDEVVNLKCRLNATDVFVEFQNEIKAKDKEREFPVEIIVACAISGVCAIFIIALTVAIYILRQFKDYRFLTETDFVKMSARIEYGPEKSPDSPDTTELVPVPVLKSKEDSDKRKKKNMNVQCTPRWTCAYNVGNKQIENFYSLPGIYKTRTAFHLQELEWDIKLVQEPEKHIPMPSLCSRFEETNFSLDPRPFSDTWDLRKLIYYVSARLTPHCIGTEWNQLTDDQATFEAEEWQIEATRDTIPEVDQPSSERREIKNRWTGLGKEDEKEREKQIEDKARKEEQGASEKAAEKK